MNELTAVHTCGMAIVGQGVATAPDLSGLRPKRKASLYADPLSWLVLDAVEHAVDDCGEEFLSERESVGHIVVSDQCTIHTMREIAAAIPAGRISPLRFSGANPGSVCSLPSQLLGFSGPSMTLSMPAEKGLPFAKVLAGIWLGQHSAAHVLLTSHTAGAAGHRVTSTIFKKTGQGD
ncbi:MAG: coronafacic acid synthetase [Streptomycetaceae bacterium]|nr:coronafacic acid synthetase [Streptomycetaceae bacterium]